MEYSFARSDERLRDPKFSPSFHDNLLEGNKMAHVCRHFPIIFTTIKALPDVIALRVAPGLAMFNGTVRVSLFLPYSAGRGSLMTNIIPQDIHKQIAAVRARATVSDKDPDAMHSTIFHEILSSKLPDSEKSQKRLSHEAQIVVGAGTLTTAWTLCVGICNVLLSPSILRTLKDELRAAIPDPSSHPSLLVLEQLPYLSAFIQESLRLSYGVITRLERVPREESLIFKDKASGKEWVIPEGTPVGMSAWLMHHDESIFPAAGTFDPSRWLNNPRLDRYLVSFSKGTRKCVGIDLGYAELYIVFAALLRRYGSSEVRDEDDEGMLELFETDLRDVRAAEDYFIPMPWSGSQGVRIKIKE
jgi:cytochrome P450